VERADGKWQSGGGGSASAAAKVFVEKVIEASLGHGTLRGGGRSGESDGRLWS